MGLDMTAYAYLNDQHLSSRRTEEQFHYWRKHQALLNWCEKLTAARGERAWDEPGQVILLAERDLDQLEAAVRNGELPDYVEEGVEATPWQPQGPCADVGRVPGGDRSELVNAARLREAQPSAAAAPVISPAFTRSRLFLPLFSTRPDSARQGGEQPELCLQFKQVQPRD
jgi:hypothetical protein